MPIPRKQKTAKTSTKTASDQSEHGSIKGVTYKKEGNLLIAEGITFQQKGLLKSAGFVWNKVNPNAWAKEMSA
ncbi:MAG: hypothetical protein LWX52_13080 [Deltaproteobacteria bacterium]|jgi:hypothetical protein|nr:hypothetical protein [Deltaproteobacteria bacterium]